MQAVTTDRALKEYVETRRTLLNGMERHKKALRRLMDLFAANEIKARDMGLLD